MKINLIITLFILFLAFSLVLIIAGRFIEAPALQLAGYCFMFLMGVVMLFNALEYQTGELTQTNNITGITNTTYTYTAYANEIYAGVNVNHIIGLFIAIISALGFAIVLMNLDKFKINEGGI